MLRIGAGGGFHYALCHILGGSFGLGHAEVHSVLLPHSVALVRDADPDATRKIADAMEVADPAHAVYDLAADLGCPQSLGEIGMPEDGLDRVVGMALDAVSSGRRRVSRDAARLKPASFRTSCTAPRIFGPETFLPARRVLNYVCWSNSRRNT
jgi:alcohol dehydrogenase class IV